MYVVALVWDTHVPYFVLSCLLVLFSFWLFNAIRFFVFLKVFVNYVMFVSSPDVITEHYVF